MVTFSGIDGSGKSTLADRTCGYMHAKGMKAMKLEVYDKSVFLNIGRLIGKFSKGTKTDMESKFTTEDKKANIIIGLLRRICFRIDIALFKLTAYILKIRGLKPVCDRYLYDTLVHLRYLKAVNDKQYSSFLNKIPAPNIAILLLLDEDAAKKREAEHGEIEYYREKIGLYKQLAENENLLKIDSSCELEAVWRNVRAIIDSKVTVK